MKPEVGSLKVGVVMLARINYNVIIDKGVLWAKWDSSPSIFLVMGVGIAGVADDVL